ncbi:hypothetical protein AB0L99_08285 [Streptomyces sp. NPDC051954]|uniref:hypothetical protein n=1 Tax=Streptomyces sp. NPDC051954 TaxID=3155524 RepID=UPI003433DBB1
MRLWPRHPRGTNDSSAPVSPPDESTPAGGLAEVRIIAADPDTAQQVARLLRQGFRCDEPRSYPAGRDGHGTLLHLTVDTGQAGRTPAAESSSTEASTESSWLNSSRSEERRIHADEPG